MLKEKFIELIKSNTTLFLIVALAAILRFVDIANMPPSLNWDEVSHGYNAFSLLKTGRDEWGKFLPVIFRAYGDYKLPVYIYVTAISEIFFGLSAFAVRLPSALAGIGTVVFTYLLAKQLFPKKSSIALLSAFLVAVEPWSLFLSRGAFEANLGLTLFTAGIYFFFKGLKKPNNFIVSAILMGLTVWTYNSYRIFTPIMILVLVATNFKILASNIKKFPFTIVSAFIILAVFLLPMFWQLFSSEGQARYGEVAIIDEGAVSQIIEARQNSDYSPFVTRLVYNRPIFFLKRLATNWSSHFTLDFLFFNGGSHYQFSVPRHGLLYFVNLPFLLLGILVLLKKTLRRHNTPAILLISWIILAPIPSSLTREAPHVLRSVTMLPLFMIIVSVGVSELIRFVNGFRPSRAIQKLTVNKTLYFVYLLAMVFFVTNYLVKYFGEYRVKYSWAWQFGYQELVQYSKSNYEKYDRIIVTKKYGEPHEFFLYFWPWHPFDYQTDNDLTRFYQSNWYWVDRFDKFYFVNDWEIPKHEDQNFVLESGESFECISQKCLLITSPGNYPLDWNKVLQVDYPNGDTAFEIYENQ